MSGSKGVHVIVEATGSGAAVEIASVPGGFARENFTFLSALEPDVAAVGAVLRNLLVFF